MGPYPVSSRLFWQIINKTRSQKTSKGLPDLIYENKIHKLDSDKANLFSDLLGNIFKQEENAKFNKKHNFIQNENLKIKLDFEKSDFFNINDIYRVLNKIKIGKSCGEDSIENIFLKN